MADRSRKGDNEFPPPPPPVFQHEMTPITRHPCSNFTLPYPNPSLSEMIEDLRAESISDESQSQTKERRTSRRIPLRRVLLTVIICLGLMFSCLDASIVSTALISLSVELQNYQDTPWTVLGYLLTYMSFAVGFSKLSDVYGRKNVLAVSWLLFTLGSVWCGFARHMGELIAGRAVQGIGGSGLYSLAQVCLLEQGPSRPEAVGALVGITLSISFVLGPLLGGGISEWNWRGIFWFNIPFGILAVLGIYALWPKDRRDRCGGPNPLSTIDFLGNALLAVGSILVVFAMQQGGSYVWSWMSPVILGSLITSGMCWILLVGWEGYLFHRRNHRIQPVFPVHLVTTRVYILTLIVTLLSGFVYIALVIKIPEQLQLIHGDNALWAGVHLLPMLGACAFGSFLGGALSKQSNLTSQTLVAGNVLQVAGLAAILGLSHRSDDGALGLHLLLGLTALYGLGVGLTFAACTMIAAIEACEGDLAAAQGAVAQARVFGGALGLATCTILFSERLQRELGSNGSLLGREELAQVLRNLMAVLNLPDGVRHEVLTVYLNAFEQQIMIMTVVAVVALVLSLGTYRRSGPRQVIGVMVRHQELAAARTRGGDDSWRRGVKGSDGRMRGEAETSPLSSIRPFIRQ